jgi:CheY-like chemotaxis protein
MEVWTSRRAGCFLQKQRVLVVDDYIDAADGLCAYLAAHGLDTRVAYDGSEALEIAAGWHPDSVILDIAMPGLSGMAVATTLRATPATRETILVAYTSQPPEMDYHRIRESGFDAICSKPAHPEWLIRLLERLTNADEPSPD